VGGLKDKKSDEKMNVLNSMMNIESEGSSLTKSSTVKKII
jgi:hypothetical protein